MTIRPFPVVLAVIVLGFTATIVVVKMSGPPEPPRPGIEQSDSGNEHVDSNEYGGDQPPTSGPHAGPLSWGVYDTEVRDDRVIHNMEHGGIYVSYQPSLPKDQIEKLTNLLSAPFSNSEFQPTKIILAPRAANKSPIMLSSWLRSEALESYDEDKVVNYIKGNLGKSPEPLAR
ncbi:MAG: DUF3105 domain-containing protein [Candidatus Microsaccharimonas sp.]